ncbi:alanine racemase [Cohnella silvisoli]|uniref:Alanine racemase n=1 Tax=Cohnella silvisoli TaxID=2873699 RepID=A0ABV1L2V7_9BACL|nr:alanine racemase [Cohnella silvisoli]MCD9025869.1 alanine racemase [Cohnella silvisoli]
MYRKARIKEENTYCDRTPALLIDVDKMEANIRHMAMIADRHHKKLRPHAKTHKMPAVARKQLQAGAAGITVAKVSEAEVMAANGIDDIFIAYPIVTASKIERVLALAGKVNRLIVGIDSLEGAMQLSQTATKANAVIEVRLEIDTGMRRTGVLYEDSLHLASRIHALDHLNLSGIFTFRGAFMNGAPTLDLRSAGIEEGNLMAELAEKMKAQGIPISDVSVGSTPTAEYAAEVNGVTEIRPGTYVFQDQMQARLGVCTLDQCAGTVLATVVSRPSPNYAVIDGGSKTFATDVQPNTEPLQLRGFGHILGAPDAVLERLSEEHGVIRLNGNQPWKIGEQIQIVPNHICSTVNLHNNVYWVDGERIEKVKVLGRGMLE